MNNSLKLLIGLLLMAGGIVSATLKIDTTWHYFGNGALFGIGAMMVFNNLTKLKKS